MLFPQYLVAAKGNILAMKYSVRNGIVYRRIANEHFLISVGDAAGICSAIEQINEGGAYYWKLLEQGEDTEQMLELAAAEYNIEKELLRPGLERYLNELEAGKYITRNEI